MNFQTQFLEFSNVLFSQEGTSKNRESVALDLIRIITGSCKVTVLVYNTNKTIDYIQSSADHNHNCTMDYQSFISQIDTENSNEYTTASQNMMINKILKNDMIETLISIPFTINNGFKCSILLEYTQLTTLSDELQSILTSISNTLQFYFSHYYTNKQLIQQKLTNRAILSLIPDSILYLDKAGTCTGYKPYKNERTLPESVIGKKVSELFSNETSSVIYSFIKKTTQHDFPVTFSYKGENRGSIKYYNAKMSAINEDSIILIIEDVTDEINFRQKDIFITQVADNIYDGVIAFDFNFKIKYANNATLSHYGYNLQEILSKSLFDLLPTENPLRLQSEIMSQVSHNGIWTGTVSGKKKDQSFFISEIKVTPLYNQTNDEKGAFVCVERDITDAKQAEIDLIWAKEAAEAGNRIKSEFIANMSHEIRTPLNSIIGFTQVLIEEEKNKEKKDILKIINTSGNNLLHIINGILDLSKIESGRLTITEKSCDIRIFMITFQKQFQYIADEKKLYFNLFIDESITGCIIIDDFRLYQIINNLLSNAFKFTTAGGVSFFCSIKNDLLSITIEDTGIGIDQDKLSDIFLPFYQANSSITREFGGTGLGLTITKKLIELMKGQITVSTIPNTGSKFTISIPINKGNRKINNPPVINATNPPHEMPNIHKTPRVRIKNNSSFKILVVDDNIINQKLVELLLKHLEVECDFANNGQDALEQLQKTDYDLLLLDMQMPVMSGEELLKIITLDAKLKNIHVIIFTAHALSCDKDRFIQMGGNDYISKPIDKEEFRKKIQARIDLKKSN